ncbi:TPA: hypothetical protein H1005_04460 [archaeon]|nr:hypothetical protein [Candidatus Naiadarchaeales archaeon SRR2090153.bin1042]
MKKYLPYIIAGSLAISGYAFRDRLHYFYNKLQGRPVAFNSAIGYDADAVDKRLDSIIDEAVNELIERQSVAIAQKRREKHADIRTEQELPSKINETQQQQFQVSKMWESRRQVLGITRNTCNKLPTGIYLSIQCSEYISGAMGAVEKNDGETYGFYIEKLANIMPEVIGYINAH